MYHLSVKPISRSAGRSATAAAAYRAGAEIADLRTGELHDYTRKRDVVQEGSEILVPPGAPAWAEDRAALWNAAEAAEKRKDARVARDYEVAIPKELTREQGIDLVRDFSAGLVERYGVAVDFNVHRDDLRHWDGTEKGWQGYHAHVLTSTRQLGPDGFGDKAEIELSDTKRKSLGLGDGASEIERIREMWEVAANRHLEQAHQAQRIDRRSLKDQGIDRDPTVHLGPGVTALERDGIPSRLGDINRQVVSEHQARVEDRRLIDATAVEVGHLYSEIVERGRGRSGESPERGQAASAYRPTTGALAPEEREAVSQALKELVRQRDQRVQHALARAQQREERRDKAYQAIVRAEPAAPKGFVDALQQKGHQQALLVWEAAKEAAARLLEQAKRLAARVLEITHPRCLAAWAHERLQAERPELVERQAPALPTEQVRQQTADTTAAREEVRQRVASTARGVAPDDRPPEAKPPAQANPDPAQPDRQPIEAAPRGVEPNTPVPGVPPKRDWNRYKALQQDLAAKGRESLQQRGVLPSDRDPPEYDRDPPERKRDRGRSR